MSSEHPLESASPAPQEAQRDRDVEPRAFQLRVGDPIPLVLTLRQLAGILQVSERALLALRKAGTHRGIKQLDAPGDPRFCGRTVKAWLDSHEPVGLRFFTSARKRRA